MQFHIIGYFTTGLVFLVLDAVWLTVMGGRLYRPILGDLLLARFSAAPAVVFYLLYVLGMMIFAVSPAIAAADGQVALIYGALFGFFAYATYDLTNQATLRNWTLTLSMADIAWGTAVSGAASVAGYMIARNLMRMWGLS